MAVAALDLGARARDPASVRFRVAHLLRVALALLIVAQLGRVPLLDGGKKEAPLLLNDLLVMATLFVGGVVALRNRRLVLDRTAQLALAFAAVGALSALAAIPRFGLTGFQFVFSVAYLVRWLVYFGVYVVVVNFVRRTDVEAVWGTLEGTILAFAGFGVFQSIFLPGFAQMVYPDSGVYVDWDLQGHRLVSTFLDPNFAGALIVVGLLVLLARMSCGVPVASWKLLLLFAALFMTVSRGAVLAFATASLLIVATRGISRRMVRFAAVFVLALIPALPRLIDFALSYNKFSVDTSAMTRVVSWVRAITILADHPVIGIGFNTYGFVQEKYGFKILGNASFGIDGGLLFIAVMTGVVGVSLYTGMIVSVVRRCRAVWRDAARTPADRGLCLGTAAATVALVVHSAFVNALLYPFLMEVLWVLWGLTFLVRSAPTGQAATR
ncbi:MAG TPA: O-antigen ligase family protein [Longimicrobiaceae bacterium]